MLTVILILLSIIGYSFYGHANSSATTNSPPTARPTANPKPTIIIETPTQAPPTATSTQAPPTATPTPSVSYYAIDIYNDFVANGLGGTDPKHDTNWSCCTYVPAGGAIYWTDSQSGQVLDIATFYNIQDAETDANDLFNKGFNANVVHACLLSYDKNVPASVINPYVQLMQQYCN